MGWGNESCTEEPTCRIGMHCILLLSIAFGFDSDCCSELPSKVSFFTARSMSFWISKHQLLQSLLAAVLSCTRVDLKQGKLKRDHSLQKQIFLLSPTFSLRPHNYEHLQPYTTVHVFRSRCFGLCCSSWYCSPPCWGRTHQLLVDPKRFIRKRGFSTPSSCLPQQATQQGGKCCWFLSGYQIKKEAAPSYNTDLMSTATMAVRMNRTP